MNTQNGYLVRKVLTTALILVLAMASLRVGGGFMAVIMAGMGVWWALTGSYGRALSCYAFFPFLIIVSSLLIPKLPLIVYALRFGPLLIGLVLCLSKGGRCGNHRLPLGFLFLYLFFAILSSIGGYSAKISIMKLINFVVFLLGIWLGTQNLQRYPKEIQMVRYFFLAIAFIVVWGSLAVLPFPAIAYPLDLQMAEVLKEEGFDAAAAYFASKSRGMNLFAGITFHSQTLAPLLTCLATFVLADMLFVEKRLSIFHLFLLIPMPIMLFMTRSRTGLLSFTVGMVMVLFYSTKTIRLRFVDHTRINQIVKLFLVFGFILLIGLELCFNTFSRWLRKTDDLKTDNRALATALTETRMDLYETTLTDFKKNPVLGMGFQVNYESEILYGRRKGLVLSAPIEKGLLPAMILGEGGIVGAIAFLMFLASFYFVCRLKNYIVTITMFTTLLATNMGEATFFSPGGAGGIMWMICVLGGFMIDTLLIYHRRLENVFMEMQMQEQLAFERAMRG